MQWKFCRFSICEMEHVCVFRELSHGCSNVQKEERSSSHSKYAEGVRRLVEEGHVTRINWGIGDTSLSRLQ